MPLNIGKVEKLFSDAGYMIEAGFVIQGKCRYLLVCSQIQGERLLIFVSSEYNFVLSSSQLFPVYDMNLISFEEGSDVVEKYADYPDEKDIEEKYESSDMNFLPIEAIMKEAASEKPSSEKQNESPSDKPPSESPSGSEDESENYDQSETLEDKLESKYKKKIVSGS